MIEKRTCMSCQKALASVKLTKLIKGTVEELYSCQECAATHSPYQKKITEQELDENLAKILGRSKLRMLLRSRFHTLLRSWK